MLRHPPRHFASLCAAHFREQRDSILRRCDAYMAGLPACAPLPATAAELEGLMERNSDGFRLLLAKLMPRLRSALLLL